MKKLFVKPVAFITCLFAMMAVSAYAGSDSYTIYLNNKLLIKEYVYQSSFTLKNLHLGQANSNDMLIINYNHCGTVGKGRSIVIKDNSGKVLKEWKFADTDGKDAGMNIPVKDLLTLEKASGQHGVNIYYYSTRFLPRGRALVSVKNDVSNTTSHHFAPHEKIITICTLLAISLTRYFC